MPPADLRSLEPHERSEILENAWVLAAVDGTLASVEKKYLRELGAESELAAEELEEIGRRARTRELKPRIPDRQEARFVLMEVVTRLTLADGKISDQERHVLDRIAEVLGIASGALADQLMDAASEAASGARAPTNGLVVRKPLGESLGELKGDLASEFDNLRALLQGRARRRLEFPLLALLAGEVTIFLGVLFLGWGIYQAVLLFWFETVVIGFFNAFRMMAARKPAKDTLRRIGKAFLIPFFMVHFGGFCFGHGTFLTLLFSGKVRGGAPEFTGPFMLIAGIFDAMSPGLIASAALLVVAHGLSFVKDFLGREEYRRVTADEFMFRPYGRIVATHVAIFLFAVPCMFLPRLAAALVVPLKMAFDMVSYRRERGRYEGIDEELAPPVPQASWVARHRAGLLSTATLIIALAVIVGGLVWAATGWRERKARLKVLFAAAAAGMMPREALHAPVPWTMAYTNDGGAQEVELTRETGDVLRVKMPDGRNLSMNRTDALKWMDETLPGLLKNRSLYLYVNDGLETVHATFRFGPDGRLVYAGPTDPF